MHWPTANLLYAYITIKIYNKKKIIVQYKVSKLVIKITSLYIQVYIYIITIKYTINMIIYCVWWLL